jgi:CheY-like chemotaxis protein
LPVLIVDDNATNRRNLHELLTHWGLQPTSVDSGQAALATLTQARHVGAIFPLLLLDATMPQMDGCVLAAQIKQEPTLAGATIIMLTSGGQRGDTARCRQLGIAASLTKPVTPAELWATILQALGTTTPTPAPALITRHTGRQHNQRLHILLAEDNVVNQKLAVRLLEKWGHTVTVVSTGKDVLTALAQQSFDLILMDVQMPEMDGLEATAAIRMQERLTATHVPIIAMTANAMQGDAEQCLAAGMDGYIAKPMRPDDLYTAITRLLESNLSQPRPAAMPPLNLITTSVEYARHKGHGTGVTMQHVCARSEHRQRREPILRAPVNAWRWSPVVEARHALLLRTGIPAAACGAVGGNVHQAELGHTAPLRQELGKTQLMPVGISHMEVALSPGPVLRWSRLATCR